MRPRRCESGQSVVFFVAILTCLAFVLALVLEVGRLAYARGELSKCADAAALAAASRVDIAAYRSTGRIVFLPDVYAYARTYAGLNAGYLSRRSIPVAVTAIRVEASTHVVAVSVSADLAPLLPSLLQQGARLTVTGYAQARIGAQ